MREGATAVVDTDNDNFPLPNFGFPCTSFFGDTTGESMGLVNVYSHFTDKKIWLKGLPVRGILKEGPPLSPHNNHSKIGVWQGLANGGPDVNALYRLTETSECIFL